MPIQRKQVPPVGLVFDLPGQDGTKEEVRTAEGFSLTGLTLLPGQPAPSAVLPGDGKTQEPAATGTTDPAPAPRPTEN